ncbi:inner membrane protein [Chlamydia abortus]|nr:inner membrane protein [Chlamydia abortus]SFW04628.1 inner membrane protein [Chlamydia abortus]
MILLPTASENKTVLLLPWDNYRTSLILRTTVCFTIAVLTCLGSIALMNPGKLVIFWNELRHHSHAHFRCSYFGFTGEK